jgi:hypothetical protein
MFQVFSVLQKCQICAAVMLQMSKSSYLCHECAIHSLMTSDFEVAGAEEKACKQLSNSTI